MASIPGGSRSFLFLAGAVALAALVAPRPAVAAWPHDTQTNLAVCTANDSQNGALSVSDGKGGAILAWTDYRGGSTADVYAQHVLASGAVDPAWPAQGRALCTAADQQYLYDLVADGAGGAIAVWQDQRAGAANSDLYAQHVLASGAVDPAWPAQGRAVCAQATSQYAPQAASDGAGGVFVTWFDGRNAATTSNDVFAQHVLAAGTLDPAWPADGLPVSAVTGLQSYPEIVAAAPGSAIVTWRDTRGASWDIYAQRVVAGLGADPAWPADGRIVCAATGQQDSPRAVGDGAGGAIIAWRDYRGATGADVYAQHVLAAGVVDPVWPADGQALCAEAGNQYPPTLVSDGAGGAIAVWEDYRWSLLTDLFAQHVLASGALDPAWPVGGEVVTAASGDQVAPQAVSDGAGGIVVAWSDSRLGGTLDVFVQHVLANGDADPAWSADGKPLTLAAGSQSGPQVTSDGAGGALVAWTDARAGATNDIYAQRVARFGVLGTPEAEIASVRDVPNDQGGQVKVSWSASWLDQASSPLVTGYDVLRSVPPQIAAARLARGARAVALAGAGAAPAPGALVALTAAAGVTYWEYLETVPALHFTPGYSAVAATTSDSLAGSNPVTGFLVLAHDDTRSRFWPSAAASGYSVDDLKPAMPQPFTGRYAAGATALHWDANGEADLAGYRLYRGSTPDFPRTPQALVAAPADTGWVDHAGSPAFYQLTAVDVHGNESAAALLAPAGTLDADDAPAGGALEFAAAPNPARASAALRFALPRAGAVRVVVHDVAGRAVRTLAAGTFAAGAHVLAWDLRDDAGAPVRAGRWYARLAGPGGVRTLALTVLR